MKTWTPCYAHESIVFVHIERPWWQPLTYRLVEGVLFNVEVIAGWFDNFDAWERFWDRVADPLRLWMVRLVDYEVELGEVSVSIDAALKYYHQLDTITPIERFPLFVEMSRGIKPKM